MAYNLLLEEQIRLEFIQMGIHALEKKMFGGVGFMIQDCMIVGVMKDDLMARIPLSRYEEALDQPYVRAMDFTRRPMPGMIYVAWEGLQIHPEMLAHYLRLALGYLDSPEGKAAIAKKSKAKKKGAAA